MTETIRCGVCGFAEVRTDTAVDAAAAAEPLLLGECPRCEHRWTAPARLAAPLVGPVTMARSPQRASARTLREVLPAA